MTRNAFAAALIAMTVMLASTAALAPVITGRPMIVKRVSTVEIPVDRPSLAWWRK